MINKNHLMLAAFAVASLTSCKKEISATSENKQPSSAVSAPVPYKFRQTVLVYSDNVSDGYLDLTVSSDNEAYLKKYTDNLRNSKLVFVESDPNETTTPENIEMSADLTEAVAVDMNWKNFNLKLEKGKNFKIGFVAKTQEKTLTLQNSLTNLTAWTSTTGYGAVTVYNTYSYWNFGTQTSQTAVWSWSGTGSNNNFYVVSMDTYDNIEVRTFTNQDPFWSPSGGIGALTSNGISGYFRPRKNYSGVGLPSAYQDKNMIVAGSGKRSNNMGQGAPATVTFHIAS